MDSTNQNRGPGETLLTLQEVARHLRVNERTVRRYLQTGVLAGRRIGGLWRISAHALEQYSSGQGEQAVPDTNRSAADTAEVRRKRQEAEPVSRLPSRSTAPALTKSEGGFPMAHKAESASREKDLAGRLSAGQQRQDRRKGLREARVVAIAIQKGGTGKTTATFNLAAELRRKGYQVLVCDLDPQASYTRVSGIATEALDITNYEVVMQGKWGVTRDTIPSTVDFTRAEMELGNNPLWGMALKKALAPHLGEYDFVLLDCPPSLGRLTVNALLAADGVVIPVQTQEEAYHGLELLLRTIQELCPTLPVLAIQPTQFVARSISHNQVLTALKEFYGVSVTTPITFSVKYGESMSAQLPIADYYPELGQPWVDLAELVERWANRE